MSKNIILCSDGTGNTAIKGRGTNVFKLFEAVDLTSHRTNPDLDAQLAFYDDGVGSGGIKPIRLLGGAIGLGLSRNVRQLYRELSRVYDDGDRIFLFGFSRGAFTVRTLAGLIGTCGILKGEEISTARRLRDAVNAAYRAYRAKYISDLTRFARRAFHLPDAKEKVATFRKEWPVHKPAKIKFIGVWDTVDAVGMPFALGQVINRRILQFKFPTQELGASVEQACHALAIDDDRQSFEPVLWKVADGDKRIRQVWFAGAHSNVGGGYPKQGMSLVALEWMLSYAADAGLRVQPIDLAIFRGHASVDDMLYDSRANWGVFYRWAPRNITKYCDESGVPPSIHVSVAERIAHGTNDYAPGNLPPNLTVVTTPTGDTKRDEAVNQRAAALERVIRDAHRGKPHLLANVKREIVLGTLSYWLFMAAWPFLLFGVAGSVVEALQSPNLFTWNSPFRVTMIGSGAAFVIAWYLGRSADKRMSDAFSGFWHEHQPTLRAELKRVKAESRITRRSVA